MPPGPRLTLSRLLGGVFLVATVGLLVAVLVAFGVVPIPAPADSAYGNATVTVSDENDTRLGRVDVRIADSFRERHTGLSETESLAENRGMLFVYDSEGNHTFVMRDMDFALDIVFVGADRRITRTHHAPVPPPGTSENELEPYRGRGRWVLEVNRNWTTEHGVGVGDRIEIERRDDA